MATGNIIIGPNNNTGLYTGVTSNTSINGGGGNGSGNYSNANVASYLQVLSSNISTTGNIYATFISATGSIRAGNALYQNGNVVRIGSTGNSSFTEYNTTSVGARAGFSGQQEGAVALGAFAGQADQQGNAVAVGRAAGNTYQGANAVAVGFAAGLLNQGANAFAMGAFAGQVNQGANSIAIGRATGNTNQGPYAIAMGFASATLNQGANAFAIGWNAGNTYQGDNAIALGPFAGNVSQGTGAIAIGRNTGAYTQGANSVAIGRNTANTNQGIGAIALGQEAGANTQGANAIAIGFNAGNNHQGINSIAIGKFAGYGSQQNNSIILNASGNVQNGNNSGLYINPVRNDTANVTQVMFFNTGTKEVTYAPQTAITANYSNANVASFMPVFAGSLGNLVEIYADDVYVTGNVTAGFFTGDGSNISNINAANIVNAYGDANVAAYLPTYNGDLNPNAISASGNVTMGSLLVAGSGTVVGDFNVLGNLTYTGINVATTSNLYINLANNQTTYANIDNAGLVVGNASSPLTQFQYKVGSNTWVTNVGISALGNVYTANLSANGNIVATGNLRINSISSAGNILGAYLSVSGNVRGGNINTVGGISATGNIIGNTLINNSTVVRLGFNAGNIASTGNVVAIGRASAQISQGDGGIAIGFQAGNNTQGGNSIAIGRNAGAGSFGAQGANSIAIGRSAGNLTQGTESIAIGHLAGNNAQGSGAIAIGYGAGYDSQPANSIIITASGNLTGTETGLYVNPVRYDVSALGNVVFFNSDTSEVTYADAGLIGGNYSNANVESYLQVLTTDVSTTGNVSANNTHAGNVFLSNGSSLIVLGDYGIQLSSNADGISNSSIQMFNNSYVAISANTDAYIQSNTGSGNDHLWTFSATGDLAAPGNISTAGNVIAGYLYGDGSNITGISGGSYGNSNVASYLEVLTSNVSTTGNVAAQKGFITQNGIGSNFESANGNAQITMYFQSNTNEYPQWIVSRHNAGIATDNAIDLFTSDGNSHAQFPANAILGLSVNNGKVGIANVPHPGNALDVGGSVYAAGNISASGNIAAAYLYGDGSNITNLPAGSYSNSNVASYLQILTSDVSTTGNVIATAVNTDTVYGQGMHVQGYDYVQMQFSNATALPVTPYDIGTGSWFYLDGGGGVFQSNTTGNLKTIILGNDASITADGNISTTGNVLAGFLYGDGSNITGLPASTGNVTFNDINVIGTGNLHLQPDPANAGAYLDVYLTTGPDIHIAGNGENLILGSDNSSNVTVGTNGNVTIQANTGTAQIWNFGSDGLLTAPGNISTVGNINAGNILLGDFVGAGNVSATGNITAAYLYGDGSNITGLPASYSNSNVESFLQVLTSDISTTGNIAAGNISITGNIYAPEIVSSNVTVYGNSIITGNLTVQGTTTTINSNVVIINDLAITLANNVSTTSALQGAGITAGNSAGDPLVSLTYDVGTDSWQSNVGVTPSANASLNLGGATNYWNNIYSTTINNSGNISAIGNVTASYIIGNGSALTSINGSNVSGTVANATYATSAGSAATATTAYAVSGSNVSGTVANATYATLAGSATTATTAGTVTTNAQSNITSVGTLTSLTVNGLISTTGNISGNYILGNGSQLTGLPATYGNSNVANYLPTYSGVLTAVGNIASTGFVSATGNVNGGNILAAGVVSATGNITANYFVGNGSLLTGISAGNYSNANVTAFLPTYTGNIGNTGNSVSVQFVNYKDVVYTGGNANTTITPDASNGSVYKYTLTGNITLNAFGGTPQAGQSMTIILTQDATGNRLLTSNMKYAGGAKTLSTAANATDIIYTFFDGTNYYATLSRAYQ